MSERRNVFVSAVFVLTAVTVIWTVFEKWNFAAAAGFATIVLLLMGIEEQL